MEKYLWSGLNRTGIYFILNEGSIIYVGKTTKYPFRIKYHIAQKMEFDSVRFIECDKSMLSYYERRWIERFKPTENQQHNKERKNAIPKFVASNKPGYYMKFRKLTRKSRIGFGTYKDRFVQNMIDAGKIVDLIQMYFNLSHITFFDDILIEMKISEEWRISKPGSDRNKGREFLREAYPQDMAFRRDRYDKFAYNESKQALQQIAIKRDSKIYHMNKNHGKA